MTAARELLRPDYRYCRAVTTRWADNDIYGHVNNAVYYQYFDSVINRYLIEEGGLDIRGGIVGFIVRSECDFLSPVHYPGEVEVGVAVAALGRSSVRYAVALLRPGEDAPCARGAMVHVFVDVASGRSVPIPDALRRALQRLTIEPAADPRRPDSATA
ncbi:MAG: acyl-CoA thioesterase [Burkholderiales bacterium]|nr:acyl-CoA thioesterase [Burkholderiales bacterium]MDE2160765.1 acyl-CoA thioesterase [Burkholderiales bacterium]MDE2501363.1 acyl-CoA thioesterase [Burkholderiales bacterium]